MTRRWISLLSSSLAIFSLFVVSTRSFYLIHEPEIPEELKKSVNKI